MKSLQDPILSFGVVADLQYSNEEPCKDRYFQNSKQKLDQIIRIFNTQNLDFVINLGDTINKYWNSFDEILPLFDELNPTLYHVLGNHDYEVDDLMKTEVPNRMGTSRYYDFSFGKWRFIVLDGNEISTYANGSGSENFVKAEELLSEEKVNANFWNGGMGDAQLTWLTDKLANADQSHEKVILFCHFPVYPVDRHNLLNDSEVVTKISNYHCVKAWFCGHNHYGNYGMLHDIHFVNVKGIVETESESAYCIVQLFQDRLKIRGFGNEISAKLNF